LAFDRDETLRRAEKALRQGRLEAAISEYARVVQEHPNDLTTLNALGDLYVRAAQSDQALPLFIRVGDAYLREGFFSKAAGFYKKVLKFTPHDEAALLKLAEASLEQGLVVDARNSLQTVLARRRTRGDLVGADEIAVRLGDLDPHDLNARLSAVRALTRLKGRRPSAGCARWPTSSRRQAATRTPRSFCARSWDSIRVTASRARVSSAGRSPTTRWPRPARSLHVRP
jgi:tetratricopeptide (TPR) repeat protein